MSKVLGRSEEGKEKKEERRSKKNKEVYQINRDQNKFFVDLSREKKILAKVINLLVVVNKKEYGREVNFKDLVVYALDKISEKDITRIQDGSLGEMERVTRHLDEYNKKNGTSISLGEFLVRELKIK